MDNPDIIVIGAGAAGLMAAYGAARSGSAKVLVLEKMPRPGRKIVITGKGRCNFTNMKPWQEFSSHIHPKQNFLRPSFYNLTPEKMAEFLESNGVPYVVERGDRAFPESHKSMDIVDALVRAAMKEGAEILTNVEVKAVTHIEDKFIIDAGRKWTCSKLIITTGGLSYPSTGSTGDGYAWAEECGHTITPLFPSLTALIPENYRIEEWVSLKNVSLTVYIDGNEAQSEFGDLDFTGGGIEGPIGFKVSRKCVKALANGSRVKISIDLKPAVETEDLERRIAGLWDEICQDKRSQGKTYKARFDVLAARLLPREIKQMFLSSNPDIDHKRIGKALKDWKMNIISNVGYERSVVTAGGVSTDEVTAKTLESKKVPGLYFAGEILDIDADTGGYNLHVAFSTGLLAGESAAR